MSAELVWQQFHFLRPWWLLALPLIFLPWLWREKGAQSVWSELVDRELLPYLLAGPSAPARRSAAWVGIALMLLLILALAGPAFRLALQPEMRREAALVLALDLSAGMLAADVQPDRLGRARFELTDLLRQRSDGQTALVAFAGDAYTVAPLTDDAATLQSMLGALAPEVMPVGGQRPERALQRSAELIEQAGMPGGDVLLVTYRVDQAAADKAAELAQRGIRVSVLLLGSDAGAPVPAARGGFQDDGQGGVLLARRDLPSARALVAAGSGIVVEASADSSDAARLQAFWESADARMQAEGEAGAQRYVDDGPWLLLLALFPLLWVLRSASTLRCAVPLLLLAGGGMWSAPASAQDGFWDSLWARADQRAYQALQQDDPASARQLAQSPDLRAAAAYREGDYAAAAEGFASAAEDPRNLYNQGTALARDGRLEEALSALDAALSAAPDMADAQHNRDVVAQALEQQREQSQSDQQGDQGEQGGESKPESAEGDEAGEAEDGQGEPGAGQEAGDPGQGESEQGSDEASEAAESDPSSTGEESAQSGDQEREAAAAEAQRKAMEQALAESQQEPSDAPPAQTAEQVEANEQQQASEQLLRQVADDPGALLRRKFALEHRRRVLEGEQD